MLERIYKYTNEAVEKGFSAKHSKSYDELVDNVCDSLILKGYAIEESEENLKKMRSPEEPRLEL